METLIGIDFGTTNSVVCQLEGLNARPIPNGYRPIGADPEIYRILTPTVLAFNSIGNLYHGVNAKNCGGNILLSLKRILGNLNQDGDEEMVQFGGKYYRPSMLATYFFKVLRYQCEKQLKKSVNKAVITIPSNSKGPQRFFTRYAAQKAGFEVVTLINEPTAAAMAYAMDLNYSEREEKVFLVYDFGGGTFDVTLLKLTGGMFYEVGSSGIRKLGGDDFDEILAHMIQKKSGIEIPKNEEAYILFRIACENAKILLSKEEHINFTFAKGKWVINCEIHRDQFENEIIDLIKKTASKIDTVIDDYKTENSGSKNLKPHEFIDHVLLVGGSCKIPIVRRFVKEYLNITPEETAENDPLLCVAKGAAISNGIIHRRLPFYYHVKMEHSLCTYVISRPNITINSIQDAFDKILTYLKSKFFITNINKFIAENDDLISRAAGDFPTINDFNLMKEKLAHCELSEVEPSGLIYLRRNYPEELNLLSIDVELKELINNSEKCNTPNLQSVDPVLLNAMFLRIDKLLHLFTEHKLLPLIKRGCGIPYDSKPVQIGLDYLSRIGFGNEFGLSVYEGNEYIFPLHSDNFKLKTLNFPIPQNAYRNSFLIILIYKYGDDGILTIEKSSSYIDKHSEKSVEEAPILVSMFTKDSDQAKHFESFKKAQDILAQRLNYNVDEHLFIDIEHALLENNVNKMEILLAEFSNNQ